MKWFKHDANASLDAKLKKLRIRYGMEGYGLYWYCLELIAGTVEKHNLTFELEHDSEVIANDMNAHIDQVQEMMSFMVELGLFDNEGGRIRCLKMATRTDEYTQKLIKSSSSVPTISRQHPDYVPTKSELIEENRIEENRIDKKRKRYIRRSDATSSSSDLENEEKRQNPCPYQAIVDLYHEKLPELRKLEKLTTTRKGYLSQRWREDLTTMNHWVNYFDFVSQSDFLMGKKSGNGDKPPFRADLEWLTRPSNFVKVAEEKYHG